MSETRRPEVGIHLEVAELGGPISSEQEKRSTEFGAVCLFCVEDAKDYDPVFGYLIKELVGKAMQVDAAEVTIGRWR